MKIKSILVSQPKPADVSKTPFADIMKKYNLESEIDEQFRRIKDLISLGCNDEGELPYNVEDYWEFVYAFRKGYLNAKGEINEIY